MKKLYTQLLPCDGGVVFDRVFMKEADLRLKITSQASFVPMGTNYDPKDYHQEVGSYVKDLTVTPHRDEKKLQTVSGVRHIYRLTPALVEQRKKPVGFLRIVKNVEDYTVTEWKTEWVEVPFEYLSTKVTFEESNNLLPTIIRN